MDHALRIDCERIILRQIIRSEDTTQRSELGIAAHGQDNRTILAVDQISVRRNVGMEGTLPLGSLTIHEPSRSLIGQRCESGSKEADFRIPPLACLFSLVQSREDACAHLVGGQDVHERHRHFGRGAVGVAVHVHEARLRLDHHIVGQSILVKFRADQSEMDKTRMTQRQFFRLQAHWFEVVPLHVLKQDVGLCQPFLQPKAALLAFEVFDDHRFAMVGRLVVGGRGPVGLADRLPGLCDIASGRLDLGHLGSAFGQKSSRQWPRKNTRQIQDPQSCQCTFHVREGRGDALYAKAVLYVSMAR